MKAMIQLQTLMRVPNGRYPAVKDGHSAAEAAAAVVAAAAAVAVVAAAVVAAVKR